MLTEYHVFVDSIHGSDVVVYDDYNRAYEEACKWSLEVEEDVIIEKVEKEIIKVVNRGK